MNESESDLVRRIMALTPGGSEFTSAHACLNWIADRLHTTAKIAGERNELRNHVTELEELAVTQSENLGRQNNYIASLNNDNFNLRKRIAELEKELEKK